MSAGDGGVSPVLLLSLCRKHPKGSWQSKSSRAGNLSLPSLLCDAGQTLPHGSMTPKGATVNRVWRPQKSLRPSCTFNVVNDPEGRTMSSNSPASQLLAKCGSCSPSANALYLQGPFRNDPSSSISSSQSPAPRHSH